MRRFVTASPVLMLAACFLPIVNADIASFSSVADNTLNGLPTAIDNNMGRHVDVHVGTSGPGGGPHNRRGLLMFDVSAIPAGSTIHAATLTLQGTSGAMGFAPASFDIFRMLSNWEEGAGSGNTGSAALSGESTWNNLAHPATAWGVPGAQAGTDYSALASASTLIDSTFASSNWSGPGVVADVTAWVNSPTNNSGWILINQSEGTLNSMLRFGARENVAPVNRPWLDVEFTPVPEPMATLLASLGSLTCALALRPRSAVPTRILHRMSHRVDGENHP